MPLISATKNAENHPPQPQRLFSKEDFEVSSTLLRLGAPATISSPYKMDLLLQDLTRLNFPNLSFASTILTGF